jgi:2Fe-2S ferredoxin
MPSVTFITLDGTRHRVEAKPGLTLLDIAHQYDIDLEGACEGSLACSTCHLVIAADWFDRLPAPSEDEADMLDLASGLTRTSRLGCQIVMEKRLDGMVVSLPRLVRNLAAGL